MSSIKEKAIEYADKLKMKEGDLRDLFIDGYRSGYVDGMCEANDKWHKILETLTSRKPSIPDAETR